MKSAVIGKFRFLLLLNFLDTFKAHFELSGGYHRLILSFIIFRKMTSG